MKNSLTTKELENYYKKESSETNRAIVQFLKESHPDTIVFGARAINVHLPEWLHKQTEDWDIMSSANAEEMATRLEKALDKHYGGDFFVVTPAKHKGTFKIRSRVTGQGVADISPYEDTIKFHNIKGINYSTLEFQEDSARKTLEDPESAYRHKKDQDTLQRIEVFRKTRKAKKQKKKSSNTHPYWDPGMAGTFL